MQDIQRLQNALLEDPSDQESLERLKVERRRRNLADLGVFLLIFEKNGFRRLKSLLQRKGERPSVYFSEREWEIIHSNNESIEIEDEEDLIYGNTLVVKDSRGESFLEAVDPSRIRSLEYNGRVKNTEIEFPNLKKLVFFSVIVKERFKFNYSRLESLSFEGCEFSGFGSSPKVQIQVSESLKEFGYDPLGGSKRLDLSFLREATNLEKVYISDEDFDITCLTSKKIRHLTLTYCKLQSLGSLHTGELKYLNLDYNRFQIFSGDFPKLQFLSMWGNPLEKTPNLEEFPSLDISGFKA